MPSPRSTRKSSRPRGRHAGEPRRGVLVIIPGELDLSWPVVGFTTVLLLVSFGPLLLAEQLSFAPHWEALLVVAGPVLVCLGFAVLTLVYGLRHAPRLAGRAPGSGRWLPCLWCWVPWRAGDCIRA